MGISCIREVQKIDRPWIIGQPNGEADTSEALDFNELITQPIWLVWTIG